MSKKNVLHVITFQNNFANVLFYMSTAYLQHVFIMLKHLQKCFAIFFANILT